MEHIVADSSADDTEESPAASNSPKEAITQPDGSATNSQAEEGCKCVLVCPIIHCHIYFHSSSMFLVFSGKGWSKFCLL